MYQAHGWWFPDQDTHFAEMLSKNIAKGNQAVYQQPVRRASFDFCNKFDLALDIGANVGLWTKDLCQRFNTVYAVEPVEDFRKCLTQNVTGGNLQILPCALGDQNTVVDMIITKHNTGHSHVDPKSLGHGTIDLRTLDSLNLPPADYVKLDCEGYEYKILLGAQNYLKKCRPVVVVEQKFHQDTGVQDHGQAVALLLSWGAKILKTVNQDVIMGW